MLYRPKEVSQYLDIPDSTLRRYARLFADYLSPTAKLRRRKYTTVDLEILEKIKQLSAEGVPIDEIGSHLAELPIEHEPINSDSMESDRRAIMPLNPELVKQLSTIDDRLDQLLAEIAALRAEMQRSWLDHLLGRK